MAGRPPGAAETRVDLIRVLTILITLSMYRRRRVWATTGACGRLGLSGDKLGQR
jgi:hypothetical protein